LFGASLDAARDFAAAHARERGWRVAAIDGSRTLFEQVLQASPADSSTGDRSEQTPLRTIRIFADFAEESNGVRVSLHAQELEAPGSDREWTTDVSESYGENLSNALASLRTKWDAAAGSGRAAPSADIGRVPAPTSPAAATGLGYSEVGVWAYYAERYSRERGCEPTETGAVLESSGPDLEIHRIECRDGSRLRVRCSNGDCTAER
jgi:hypothetical protein